MQFCGWPSSAPTGAQWFVRDFQAWDFAPNPVQGQDNPPLVVVYPTLNAWFSTAIRYPQPVNGGSWAQTTVISHPYTDAGENPYFRIAWTASGGAGVCNWHVHMTAAPDGTAMAGGGPGTQVSDTIAAVNDLMITDWIQVPATGAGSSWGPDRTLNINVYRGLVPPDTIAGPVELFTLQMRYRLT